MNLEQKIEAILFFKGEPISRKRLSDILSSSAEPARQLAGGASDGQGKFEQKEIDEAIEKLKISLQNRGVTLVENGNEIMLGTAPELSKLIEDLQKEELNKELSKASLETLSIILYKNGASRAEIDYIRGVNSSFTLRALSIRGLVEKIIDTKDSRRYIYKPSFELMSFMGIKSIEELPEYQEVNNNIDIMAKNLEDLSAEAEETKN